VFVFASTIGVFASPLPPQVDDGTPAAPQMTYGAQKLVGEILVADFSRRGWVDGRSLRLPGVLARPPARTGQMSAFMSDMIRELGAGRPITLPVRPEASTWASSIVNVVDNLLHAATVPAASLPARRSVTLPTLHFSFAQLVAAIGAVRGEDVSALASWQPDARIEALFGSFPPITTAAADAAGFRNDGSLEALVRRSTQLG
jgi:nucleoside-diphosphate-sugar epimerase